VGRKIEGTIPESNGKHDENKGPSPLFFGARRIDLHLVAGWRTFDEDLDAELFAYLANYRRFRSLAGLEFAAGEFP
jgi:hypothetical protein